MQTNAHVCPSTNLRLIETDTDYSACLSVLSTISPTASSVTDDPYLVTDLLEAEYENEVNKWMPSSSPCLFRTSGKAADTNLVAASLFHHFRKMSLLATYFSFRSHDRRRSPLITILASLISQMLIQDPSKFDRVKHLVTSMLQSGSWMKAGLLNLFKQVLCAHSHREKLVVVVEFHEWISSRKDIFDAILILARLELPPGRLKIALFGPRCDCHQRALDELGEHHVESPKIFKRVAEVSAENFFRNKPELLPLRSEIADAFARCESASALTVTTHYLRETTGAPWTLRSLRDSIRAFMPCISDIVSSRLTHLPQWAVEAIGWVLLAKRPLRSSELVTAINASEICRGLYYTVDGAEVPLDIEAGLQSAFGPLLRIERGYISISHDDVREALENNPAWRSPVLPHTDTAKLGNPEDAPHAGIPDHGTISAALIHYLTSLVDKERLNKASGESAFTGDLSCLGLVSYASEFWSSHYLEAERTGRNVDINTMVLLDQDRIHSLSELIVKLDPTSIPRGLYVDSPSLLAAQLGIFSIVEKMGSTLEGPKYDAAIGLASWAGQGKVVGSLLNDTERSSRLSLRDALRYASARGHDDIVTQLLDHMSSSHESPALPEVAASLICQAAQLGFETQVSRFAQHGGNANDALQHAAKNGHASVVKMLLDDGNQLEPDVNWTSEELSDTPIMLAVSGGHRIVVEQLLISSADLWTRTSGRGTILHVAASHGYDDILELLLEHFTNPEGSQPLEGTETLGIGDSDANSTPPRIIDVADSVGKTALMIACQAKHERSANSLLEDGADVTLKDEDCHTALYHAVCANKRNLGKAIMSRASSIYAFPDIDAVFYQACASGFTELVTLCIQASTESAQGEVDKLYQFRTSDLKRTPLHAAAASGHLNIVDLLLGEKFDVDSTDYEDKTPLCLAATSGHVDIVKCLIDAGAEATHRDSAILRDIISVSQISAAHCEIIRMLLEKGADPNEQDDDGRTSLHMAVYAGNIPAVRLLVEYKADPSRQDEEATTALHLAAARGGNNSVDVARVLVKAGSDIYESDIEGWTPAHIAAMWANIDMLQYLWSCDHEVLNRPSHNGRTALHFAFDEPRSIEWLLDHKARVDAADNAGETTLMIAAGHGMTRSVELLLKYHADAQLADWNGKTALHHIAGSAGSSNEECARKLLQSRPILLECRDADKHSPLSLAISSSNIALASILLKEFYPSMDATRLREGLDGLDAEGNTPLLLAIEKRELDVAKQLMELGANPNIRNKRRHNALLIAVYKAIELDDLKHMIRILVDESDRAATRAYVNAGGGLDASALHLAAQLDEPEFVEYLIELGADVNFEGGPYKTALMAAAAGGCEEVVDLLLKKGADREKSGGVFPNAFSAALSSRTSSVLLEQLKVGTSAKTKDNQGRTTMHIAARLSLWSTIKELETCYDGSLVEKDVQGRTLLHHAAMSGSCDFFVEFEASHADIFTETNVKDRDGWTPLHWACRYNGGKEILDFLKSRGASLLEATNDGWTPENIAIFHEADDIVDWLAQNRTEQGQERWQVGSANSRFSCDGCGLMASTPSIYHV